MAGMFDRQWTRREFLCRSAVGGAGLAASTLLPFLGRAQETKPPVQEIEPDPVVKVLRWGAFVQSDEEVWLANTCAWEKLTGGRVETDWLPWPDVRPKAIMEATLGAGHDIVFGWFDDPHLFPDKLLDLSDIATYLGSKYGGWYPICEEYGQTWGTKKWIALPLGILSACINYRSSWLREAGYETFPAALEQFIACCRALKAKGHPTGFALGHAVGDANTWTHWWLWAFGGKAVEGDGKSVAINSPETRLGLETARELYATMLPGVEKWQDPDNNQLFLDGALSMTNNGASIAYAARLSYPEVDADLGVANFPIGPVGRPTELGMISQAFIFNFTTVPKAARHFLTFLFESEQYTKWITGARGYVTQSLRAFHDLAVWTDDPAITPFRDVPQRMLSNGHAGPLGMASAAAMSEYIIVDMFAEVCSGARSPRAAALRAEERLTRLYA